MSNHPLLKPFALFALLTGLPGCGGPEPGSPTGHPPGKGPAPMPGTGLRFAVFGDTRPASSSPGAPYPSAVVEAIFRAIDRQAVQFVIVNGDYIYVNGTDEAEAGRQMDLFLAARKQLSPMTPVHYIMGNHEKNNIPTYQAKLSQQIYWRIDQMTEQTTGQAVAKLLGIANDAWDGKQHDWLDKQLADPTKYTFVFRHQYWGSHGVNATTDAEIRGIVDAHPYTLFIAGHDHAYKHKSTLIRGEPREVVSGTGGAPFDGAQSYGHLIVEEKPGDKIQVTAYKVEPGMDVPPVAIDTWSVSP